MIDLAPCLSLELINALFERMKKVPLSEYDLETLNVVYLFTITALSKINVKKLTSLISSIKPFFF